MFSLVDGNARIVGSMQDQQRSRDAIDRVDGRNPLQHVAMMGKTAIFRFSPGTTPGASLFEERDEIGDANHINGCGPQFGVSGDGSEHHITAVASTHDANTLWVRSSMLNQPFDASFEIGNAVRAQVHIVEMNVCFAITKTAANVGGKDRETALEVVLQRRHPGSS